MNISTVYCLNYEQSELVERSSSFGAEYIVFQFAI